MRYYALLVCIFALTCVASCLGPDLEGPGEAVFTEQSGEGYVQAVAEQFAPFLWFDQDQGEPNKCFPSSAEEYYEARKSGDHSRICNTSYNSIENGEIPIYYEYKRCQAVVVVSDANGDTADGCVTLLAGQTIDVGTVCVEFVDKQLRVTYTMADGWELTEAHLWVGENLEDLPHTQKGNPIVGHFPYHSGEIEPTTSYSFYVDISSCNQELLVAAHAEVRTDGGDGTYLTESAWGSGTRIVEKGNWATYFSVDTICTEIIMYWFYYGYQDTCDGVSGAHDADWERIAVKIVGGQLDRVLYFQHKGRYTRVPGNYEVYGETHPVVYVGRDNHGSYHDDGGTGTCCYFEDFRNPGDPQQHMETWLNLVHLSLDDDSPEWMRYSGTEYWDGLTGPLHRDHDLCYLQGCEGAWTPVCHTNGCMKSDIGDDIF